MSKTSNRFRCEWLEGGVERPKVIRQRIAALQGRVAQLQKLLSLAEELEAAEVAARDAVLEGNNE